MTSTQRKTLSLGAVAVTWLLLAYPTIAAPRAPDPPVGQRAATTMALLSFQKETCDVLAVRVIDHWRDLGPVVSREIDEERIRDYVLKSQLSDLAASRSAGDLVERFLPGSRSETNAETVASMRRLDGLTTELCDAVAIPVAPLSAFDSKIQEILERLEVEQAELGRLLVVSDEVEQAALEPYLIPIQIAGIEAEGEYLEYLDSIRPKAAEPTIHEKMRAWHHQVYGPAVAPVKKSFGELLAARSKNRSRAMSQACRQVSTKVSALLRNNEAFQAPDPRLEQPLRSIYQGMRRVAVQCSAGRSHEVQRELQILQGQLKEVGSHMERYRLSP